MAAKAAFGRAATARPEIPTAVSAPTQITAGPDGNVWFTEQNTSAIGRVTTAGTVTELQQRT